MVWEVCQTFLPMRGWVLGERSVNIIFGMDYQTGKTLLIYFLLQSHTIEYMLNAIPITFHGNKKHQILFNDDLYEHLLVCMRNVNY